MSNKDVFAELNAAIKANDGLVPDRFTIEGQTFVREGAKKVSGPVKKLWRNPKNGKESMEDVETVVVDVAPYADRVTLDGVIYLANRTYELPVNVARAVRDVCAQTWRHEAQTGGAYSFGTGASVRNPAHLAGRSGVGFA